MKSLLAFFALVCAVSEAVYVPGHVSAHHYTPYYTPYYGHYYGLYRHKREADPEPQPEAEAEPGTVLTVPVTHYSSYPVVTSPVKYTYTTPVKYTVRTPVQYTPHTYTGYNPYYTPLHTPYYNPYYFGLPVVPAVKNEEENPAEDETSEDDAIEVSERKKRATTSIKLPTYYARHPFVPVTTFKKASTGPSTTVVRYAGYPGYHYNPYPYYPHWE